MNNFEQSPDELREAARLLINFTSQNSLRHVRRITYEDTRESRRTNP